MCVGTWDLSFIRDRDSEFTKGYSCRNREVLDLRVLDRLVILGSAVFTI